MRLAAQDDDEEEDEEDDGEFDGRHNMVPQKDVRAAIVDDVVQVAQVVRESCDAVNVSSLALKGSHNSASSSVSIFFLEACNLVACIASS